jgi:hypothetical protein
LIRALKRPGVRIKDYFRCLRTQGRRGSSTGDLLVSETRWANKMRAILARIVRGSQVDFREKRRVDGVRGRGILMRSERVKEGPLVLQRGGEGGEW